jgi:hypothetical protein
MGKGRLVVASLLFILGLPLVARAQDRRWTAEFSTGYAGFLDDATQHFGVVAGGLRRYVTPRVSIGPELTVMAGGEGVRDRNIMLTGNVVFDLYPDPGADSRRLVPFLVGGAGIFRGRDIVRDGHFWSSEPGFTMGGGVRARINEVISASLEYRVGWEAHHRVTGSVAFRW